MKRIDHPHKGAVNWLIYDLIHSHLLRSTNLFRGKLYDLGCGVMPYRDFFLQYCQSYVGVDWCGTQHELKADVIANLNEVLPIADCQADTVVSMSVLEH